MLRVFLLLITITASSAAIVKWMPNKSFSLAINFRDRKLPCSRQNVVFPESVAEAVIIQADVAMKEIVLPATGDIIFEDGITSFGIDENDNCTEEGNAYYSPRSKSSWVQPDVWSSTKFNEATPDAERIPCYDDEVVFPSDSQFTVLLPLASQHIRRLKIFGQYYDNALFRSLARSQDSGEGSSQQFILNDLYGTGVIVEDKGCTSPTGCPCQNAMMKMDCSAKFCPVPKCLDPVQPIGHCCKICGGYFIFNIGERFDMLSFEENVATVINSYGKDELVYHVGILPNNKVQVVVVEKGEYSGSSAEAVSDLDYKFSSRLLKGEALYSGAPLSKAGMGGKIAVSMFFVVVLVMGAIYAYYYKMPQLPEFRYPGGVRSRGVLTRFQRRTDSVVSLTSRRDSTATLRSGLGTAFRNPLYDSKRGRVEVTESVAEEERE
ncbi:protein amnionless [Pectinophora gossypiella]|uniref:protein amnionless n=1 Tax=Pectinophora gossypiella TaxID=13191 RepID=UPI00214E0D6C|nr:protein amnionless [Pectinophora gossypiella]